MARNRLQTRLQTRRQTENGEAQDVLGRTLSSVKHCSRLYQEALQRYMHVLARMDPGCSLKIWTSFLRGLHQATRFVTKRPHTLSETVLDALCEKIAIMLECTLFSKELGELAGLYERHAPCRHMARAWHNVHKKSQHLEEALRRLLAQYGPHSFFRQLFLRPERQSRSWEVFDE